MVLRLAPFLAVLLVALPAFAQTSGTGAPQPGIGLTEDHRRIIYREIGDAPSRSIPAGAPVEIGAEIPDSVILNEMPIALKDQVGVLRDFKFAKAPEETIVIVDPAKRQIVDIVTRRDGAR